jgi:hypothetical protein
MKRLLNTKDASEMLSISERLLWSLTKLGEITSTRIRGRVLYDVQDIEAFIERNKTRPRRIKSTGKIHHGTTTEDC